MNNLFIHYPKCSTCIKARKWLDNNHISYISRHIVDENPTTEELTQWITKSGLPVKKFFNTSGNLYKELKLSEQLSSLTESEQISILATNGMLVKRPILVTDSCVLVGFKDIDQWEQLI